MKKKEYNNEIEKYKQARVPYLRIIIIWNEIYLYFSIIAQISYFKF